MQCKDPTKIPKERLYVFKDKIHLILFSAEGYEQVDSNSDGGSDKGDNDDKKGEQNVEEDMSDIEKGGHKGAQDEGKGNNQDPPATEGQGTKSKSAGSNVKRMLFFDKDTRGQHKTSMDCANLLRAMELEQEEDPEGGADVEIIDLEDDEDDYTCQLPEEWVFHIIEERNSLRDGHLKEAALEIEVDRSSLGERRSSTLANHSLVVSDKEESNITMLSQGDVEQVQDQVEQKKGKEKKKNQWGPTISLRRSARLGDDGRLMMEKAQEAKRKWNLEDKTGKNPRISKTLLSAVAKEIGLDNLDGNPSVIDSIINLDNSRTAAF